MTTNETKKSHDKPWKVAERKVAKALGGRRTPLSGSNSLITSGDVVHPRFYVEVKYRKSHSILTLMADVVQEAKKEGKTPLLVLCEAKRKRRFYLISESDLLDLLTEEGDE